MVEVSLFPREESPGFLVHRTATLLKSGLRTAFQENGMDVTPEQWSVLGSLWEEEGVHQSLLAEKTNKDRHNITRILDLMERRGLIQRKPDRNDKRRQQVFLTEAGKRLEQALVPIASEFLLRAFHGLTQRQISMLKEILAQITGNLIHKPGARSKTTGVVRASLQQKSTDTKTA